MSPSLRRERLRSCSALSPYGSSTSVLSIVTADVERGAVVEGVVVGVGMVAGVVDVGGRAGNRAGESDPEDRSSPTAMIPAAAARSRNAGVSHLQLHSRAFRVASGALGAASSAATSP